MKVYVATKLEEKERARAVMAELRAMGHTITYDWTTNDQVNQEQAMNDFEGVLEADALVLIAERDLPYCGTLVEFGMALALNIPVYVLGNALDRCIFMRLPEIYDGLPHVEEADAEVRA